jgi:hypothetical protein
VLGRKSYKASSCSVSSRARRTFPVRQAGWEELAADLDEIVREVSESNLDLISVMERQSWGPTQIMASDHYSPNSIRPHCQPLKMPRTPSSRARESTSGTPPKSLFVKNRTSLDARDTARYNSDSAPRLRTP